MKHFLLSTIALLGIALTSCNDEKLAKSADGKWATSLTLKDEYGTPYTQGQTYVFNYVKSDSKDGGSFTEQTETAMTEEEDDFEVSYTAKTSIRGEWEIIFGDLYMTYDLSSLDVAITDVDYKLSDGTDFSTRLDYAEAAIGAAMFGQELINKKELAEEIRKNAYKSFYEVYESSNDEGSYYEELKIENGVMSFQTSDVGRMRLRKVEDNIPVSK